MVRKIGIVLLVIVIIVGVYGAYKPLPEGVSFVGEVREISEDRVHFLADRTYVNEDGVQVLEHEIFDEKLDMIAEAEQFILLDMFLYNDLMGAATADHRELSRELTEALISRAEERRDIYIHVITDPINTLYGSYGNPRLKELEEAGVDVTVTDLSKLRDSNPVYSALWRSFLGYVPPIGGRFLPNPFDPHGDGLTLSSYLDLLNFKANHRKIVIADRSSEQGREVSTLITSGNPHDASSAHSNTAVRVDGALWPDVLASERSVARFSGSHIPDIDLDRELFGEDVEDEQVSVQVRTEGEIKRGVMALTRTLSEDDKVSVLMFYLSDRDIIRELKKADRRGATVRIILDPNKDSFGRERGGVPNRQVAYELMTQTDGGTTIRWCLTHGEQCHGKMLIFEHGDRYTLVQGSANLTSRNLDDKNLETNIFVQGSFDAPVIADAIDLFDEMWGNEPEGHLYTTEYRTYEDARLFPRFLYRFGEYTGMSTY